jgi:gamma-glutamyltranspeptidase/glutathione hydrolase
MAISVAGGDVQDQTTLNVLLNVLEYRMSPAEAVTAPRFCTRHHEDSFKPVAHRPDAYIALNSLLASDAIPQSVRDDLSARGHRVTTTTDRIADPSMILLDGSRILAAGDPKAGRHAAAF